MEVLGLPYNEEPPFQATRYDLEALDPAGQRSVGPTILPPCSLLWQTSFPSSHSLSLPQHVSSTPSRNSTWTLPSILTGWYQQPFWLPLSQNRPSGHSILVPWRKKWDNEVVSSLARTNNHLFIYSFIKKIYISPLHLVFSVLEQSHIIFFFYSCPFSFLNHVCYNKIHYFNTWPTQSSWAEKQYMNVKICLSKNNRHRRSCRGLLKQCFLL